MKHLEGPITLTGAEIVDDTNDYLTSSLLSGSLINMKHLEGPITLKSAEIVDGTNDYLTSSLLSGRLIIMRHLKDRPNGCEVTKSM
jgi:hypothetical protein